MSNFWNQTPDEAASTNGVEFETQKATAEERERLWQVHDASHGRTGGGMSCPICLRNRNAETAAIVAQRNARLKA